MPAIIHPTITHHGAFTGVTGSCHELSVTDGAAILIDCGLFQGDEAEERDGGARGGSDARRSAAGRDGTRGSEDALNDDPMAIEFSIEHVRALVLTHVHIDHCGRIPWLLAAGFRGPIYCTEPSAYLLPLMLEDAFKVGISRDRRLIDEYLDTVIGLVRAVPYGEWRSIVEEPDSSLAIRFQPAGHILGSAYVQCRVRSIAAGAGEAGGEADEAASGAFGGGAGADYDGGAAGGQTERDRTARRRTTDVLFSGDLGAPYAPILPAPKPPYGTDVLVLESTYGDRLHQGRRDRRKSFQAVVEHALENRGTVLIPAFSLGRTQELLYELEDIIHDNRGSFVRRGLPWEDLEIVLDSPLAGRITQAFRDLKPFWDAEATRLVASGRRPLTFEQLTPVEAHADHLNTVDYLKRSGRPAIVISASGMCTGGRIVNYIKELIGDERTDILFVGYQARGTPGWAIQTYGPEGGWVALDGRRYTIRAAVHTITGYSAHADQRNLVSFARRMRKKPKEIRLVHGDREAKEALASKLRNEVPGAEVVV